MSKKEIHHEHKSKKPIVVRIIILIILLLLLLLLFYRCGLFQKATEPIIAGDLFPGAGNAEDGYLPSMTEEEIKKQMQKVVDASQFSFKINVKPRFENGKSDGNLRIENPNYNVYPMVVQIVLDDTDEIIYDSGGILPNHYIDNAKLSKNLAKGIYQATANLYAYDPDSLICQGQSAAKLTIIIEN